MKILLIEDEPKVAMFIKQGLEENDHDIELVYDGKMGLKFALERSYDIRLMDVIIPYINGIELCKAVKKEKPNVPVLMLTALSTTDDKVSGFDAGADDYLVKPFEFKELLVRIKALTRRGMATPTVTNIMKVADLELDLDKKIAIRNGEQYMSSCQVRLK